MRFFRRSYLVYGGGLLTALALLVSERSEAQTAKKGRVPFEGTHAFRILMHNMGLQPVRSVADFAKLPPRDTLVIVFGDSQVLDDIRKITGGLHKLQERGGAILIASDRADASRLADLKVAITGSAILVDPLVGIDSKGDRPLRLPKAAYRGKELCPFVTDCIGMRHPIFRGLTKGIATNEPAHMRRAHDCDLLHILNFPKECCTLTVPRIFEDAAWEIAFAYGTSAASGPNERVLILGGHGVFINGMMGQQDNDNFRFASNCLSWLTNDGKRKHILFVEEGKVVTDFNVPLIEFPLPTVQLINQLLHGLEKENFFNQLLHEVFPKDRLLRIILIILSMLLAVVVLRRLARAWHRIEPALPRITARLAKKAPALPIVTQRQRALLESGNFWEAARELARHCFESASERPARPPTAARGGKHQRAQLQSQVHLLWRLAYDQSAQPLTVADFAQLVTIMEAVHAALVDGTLVYRQRAAQSVLQPVPV